MNVGQGDGAVLVSPKGMVVLFDNGVRNNCDLPVSYLQQLGITKIDYHITSHYHDDHIGCTTETLPQSALQIASYDYGGTYSTSIFSKYKTKVGSKRQTAIPGSSIILDQGSPHPVTIEFPIVKGNGNPVKSENDKSVVVLVRFGSFDAELGGDLSGQETSSYHDIETRTAHLMPQVEVYKVHHHGSQFSTNDAWLSKIKPMIAIISAGVNNEHGHPTAAALDRLHKANVKTYWTTAGSGKALPKPGVDIVGGNIIIEVAPGSNAFTVTHNGSLVDTYYTWGSSPAGPAALPYSWSKLSSVYHFSNCSYVKNISPANLQTGSAIPAGRMLHAGCPR